MLFWKLNGHTPVPVDDTEEWAAWFNSSERHVGNTTIGKWRISTVFLGINHDFTGHSAPILFETMVFEGDGLAEDYQARYATWDQAKAGHDKVVKMIRDYPAERKFR